MGNGILTNLELSCFKDLVVPHLVSHVYPEFQMNDDMKDEFSLSRHLKQLNAEMSKLPQNRLVDIIQDRMRQTHSLRLEEVRDQKTSVAGFQQKYLPLTSDFWVSI